MHVVEQLNHPSILFLVSCVRTLVDAYQLKICRYIAFDHNMTNTGATTYTMSKFKKKVPLIHFTY